MTEARCKGYIDRINADRVLKVEQVNDGRIYYPAFRFDTIIRTVLEDLEKQSTLDDSLTCNEGATVLIALDQYHLELTGFNVCDLVTITKVCEIVSKRLTDSSRLP